MANIDEANEIIADNSDADMTEMAKMQLEEAKERLPELEEEIKFMLIPKDPEDAKKMSWWKFVPERVGMKEYFAGRFVPVCNTKYCIRG
jgi:hypothetical protein